MKKTHFYLIIASCILLIVYLLFGQNEKQPITEQEIQQLSKTFGDKFAEMRESQQNKAAPSQTEQQKPTQIDKDASVQAILGIIYKKTDFTWFIKAKDSQKRINKITDKFKQYFLTELKFDDNQQPIFSHLPDGSKIASTSSMRYATFMVEGIEVSVINLPGKQDTFSNVKRWMKQVGLTDKSPISMKFLDNKKTIFVKMPK